MPPPTATAGVVHANARHDPPPMRAAFEAPTLANVATSEQLVNMYNDFDIILTRFLRSLPRPPLLPCRIAWSRPRWPTCRADWRTIGGVVSASGPTSNPHHHHHHHHHHPSTHPPTIHHPPSTTTHHPPTHHVCCVGAYYRTKAVIASRIDTAKLSRVAAHDLDTKLELLYAALSEDRLSGGCRHVVRRRLRNHHCPRA